MRAASLVKDFFCGSAKALTLEQRILYCNYSMIILTVCPTAAIFKLKMAMPCCPKSRFPGGLRGSIASHRDASWRAAVRRCVWLAVYSQALRRYVVPSLPFRNEIC